MKKRIISLFLILILAFGSAVPVHAKANSYDDYSKSEKAMIVSNYVNLDDLMTKRFYTPENLAYWSCIEEITENKFNETAIEVASNLIGENADKEQCTEFLVNLYMMQQLELENAIKKQSKYDNLTDLEHYLERIGKICLSGISAKGIESLEVITTALGAAGTAEDFYDNYGDAMKYYSYIASNYQGMELMCSAIEKHAENKALRKAAKEMKSVGRTLSDEQLKSMGGMVLEDIVSFDPLSYSMDLLPVILETRSMSAEEKEICKKLEAAGQVLASINFGFEAGMLFGDVVFGTTNTFRRYQEMKIMADIAQCLVKSIDELDIKNKKYTDKNLDAINEWCAYNRTLLTVHGRGEYLIHQLVTKDGSIQSNIYTIAECYKILAGECDMTVDEWYEEQNKFFIYYMELVNSVFNVSLYDQYKAVIKEREEAFGEAELYNMWLGGPGWTKYLTGVCFLSLIDFNQDGTEELLLAYYDLAGMAGPGDLTGRGFTYEVWGPVDGKVTLLETGTPFGHDGGNRVIKLYEVDGNIYLQTGSTDSFNYFYFHGFEKDEFCLVKSLEREHGAKSGKIDNKKVKAEKVEKEEEIWCRNLIGEYYLTNEDGEELFRMIKETKAKLGNDE